MAAATSALISGIAALGTAGINAAASSGITARARSENYMYNELAAGNADARTRALYNDLYSPKAQIQQLKEAGLSPSVYFDGGAAGMSGQAGAQGQGIAGPVPSPFYIDPMAAAQIGNINADTELKKSETSKNEAETATQRAQTANIELDNYVKEHTKDANIFTICELADKAAYEASKACEEMKQAQLLTEFNEKTFDDRVETVKKELAQISQSIAESQSKVRLNDQQKQYLRNEVLVTFDTVAQKWKELDLEEKRTETYSDWIDAQIPIIEKQLEIKLQELGIEKKKLVINAITDVIKSLAMGAMAASSMGIGKGSDATPTWAKPSKEGQRVKYNPNEVPTYKRDYVWGQ